MRYSLNSTGTRSIVPVLSQKQTTSLEMSPRSFPESLRAIFQVVYALLSIFRTSRTRKITIYALICQYRYFEEPKRQKSSTFFKDFWFLLQMQLFSCISTLQITHIANISPIYLMWPKKCYLGAVK